ncbi:DegV family EDD domain-containing protein [Secundilactobacillus kimchicus]|uniref:DegV family protein n=1 Tax=Secundilactobacillus kimchicus TaxID=528209 RepID=UPI001C02CE46|nr:DegV family protein [Secundilactobacillus kimchicus]MBT9671618.1 DegV family EDD domain-containing protein [Secundilactobacillus kimchicus]
MTKTAIVTDSASYLDAAEAKKWGITVVPITVIFGRQTFLDNVDITTEEFYTRMAASAELPTTAQITPEQMKETYDRLAEAGYEAVISIHLSSGITSFYDNLVNFLPAVDNIKVYPFDSKIASAGEANLATLAARLAMADKEPEEIIAQLTKFRETIDAYFVVDDLTHLVRTGRLSNASSFIGNLLRIKPILTFNDNAQIVAVDRERTMKRAWTSLKKRFSEADQKTNYPLRLTIVDADAKATQVKWVAELQAAYPDLTIDTSNIGPVVGVHVGAGTMALLWDYDWEQWPID